MALSREDTLAHLTAAARTWRAGGVLLRSDIALRLALPTRDTCFGACVSREPTTGQCWTGLGLARQTCLCKPVGRPMRTWCRHSAGQRRRYPAVALLTALAAGGPECYIAAAGGQVVSLISREYRVGLNYWSTHGDILLRRSVGFASSSSRYRLRHHTPSVVKKVVPTNQ